MFGGMQMFAGDAMARGVAFNPTYRSCPSAVLLRRRLKRVDT
jgi:hypothetical protein